MSSIAIAALYVAWKFAVFLIFEPYASHPPEMALAQYTPKDVVGDLGGMTVVIPRHYAEYVEYDGDPYFGETRKGQRPERTLDSRLRSFGMNVRFPDMNGLKDWHDHKEMRNQSLHENPWLYVVVSAGTRYYGDGSLDRLARVVLEPEDYPEKHWWNNYVRLPESEYGLEVYVVSGTDPRTGKPARESNHTSDIYLHRQPSDKVAVYIVCRRTNAPHGVASCDMKFTLEPKAHVMTNVSFRRGLLPEWKKIEESVRDLLFNFEANEIPRASSPNSGAMPPT